MGMRSVAKGVMSRVAMEGGVGKSSSIITTSRWFSADVGKGGRILDEEERARENAFIQKMEREKLEKLKQKGDAGKEKEAAQKKSDEGTHKD